MGRDFWGSARPHPLLQQGHSGHVQLVLNSSKDGGTTTPLGNPCQFLATRTVKKCLLTSSWRSTLRDRKSVSEELLHAPALSTSSRYYQTCTLRSHSVKLFSF